MVLLLKLLFVEAANVRGCCYCVVNFFLFRSFNWNSAFLLPLFLYKPPFVWSWCESLSSPTAATSVSASSPSLPVALSTLCIAVISQGSTYTHKCANTHTEKHTHFNTQKKKKKNNVAVNLNNWMKFILLLHWKLSSRFISHFQKNEEFVLI